MRCSKCGSDNREGRKFCVQCGQALKLACVWRIADFSTQISNSPHTRYRGTILNVRPQN